MSHKRGITRRARADDLSMQAVGDGEPTPGLTTGDLTNPPSNSVDPQQSPEVLTPEHPDEPYAQAHGVQTVPSRVQSPLRAAGLSHAATQGLSPSRLAGMSGTAHQGSASPRGVAGALGTATQGSYSPRGMGPGSGSWQNLGDAPSEPECVSSDPGDTEDEGFLIPAKEVSIICKEYTEFINLKENTEIVVAEAMEATERVNIVFKRIRTSMNRMSPCMKEIFMIPSKKASGKTWEPGNNQVHDKATAIAATEQIIAQMAIGLELAQCQRTMMEVGVEATAKARHLLTAIKLNLESSLRRSVAMLGSPIIIHRHSTVGSSQSPEYKGVSLKVNTKLNQERHLWQEECTGYIQEIARLRGQLTESETLRHFDKAQIQGAESHCTLAKLMNQSLREQLDNTSKPKARKGLHTGSRLLTAPELFEEFEARRQEEEAKAKKEAAAKEAKESGIRARELE
ncbi:hypothetical protein M422DRAFT_269439 [Sphaerobolus stellatus SS14]|uniref:Uncharacterized protein n=1 Tax=Sphaerobolus stellatus (strain SS14) TaxID=990650 RepID=A0A0C9UJV1_SPHS4|nr:hypothetical protein M422DRAFT_269439 [Sphaerobolus stellatus SS14]